MSESERVLLPVGDTVIECLFVLGGGFVTVGRVASHSWFDGGYASSCVGSRIFGDFHVLLREGGPRIPRSMPGAVRTWKSGLYFHGPPCIWLHASDYGGSSKNSCTFFYVKVYPFFSAQYLARYRKCVSSWVRGRFPFIFFVKGNSDPEVHSCPAFLVVCVSRRMDKCAQTMLQFARVALEIWTLRLRALPI